MSPLLPEPYLPREDTRASPLHGLDPRCKLLALLAIVAAALVTPLPGFCAYAAYLGLLLMALAISRIPIGHLLRFLWLPALPVAAALVIVPIFSHQPGAGWVELAGGLRLSRYGLEMAWRLLARSSIALLGIGLLAVSTPTGAIFAGLARMGVPRGFCAMLAMTWRYVFVLADEIAWAWRARKARCWQPRWLGGVGALGDLAGAVFLRTLDRGERIERALDARLGEASGVLEDASAWTKRESAVLLIWLSTLGAIWWGLA